MNKESEMMVRWLGGGNENMSQNTTTEANPSSSSGGVSIEKAGRRRRRRSVIESVLDRGVTGRLCSWSESMLHGTSMGMHSCVGHCGFRGEVVGLQTGSLHDAMLGGQRRVYLHDGAVQCVEMDRIGELCATGDSHGLVMVNYVSSIHGAVSEDGGMCDTALSLQTSTARRKIVSLRWNPINQDELAVVHQRATRILVYDINRTRGQPSHTYTLPTDVHGGHDLVYFNQSSCQGQSYCSAVGCGDGSVLLWDSRKKGSPACSLRGLARSGASVSLDIVDHGRLVLGGTSRDQIHVWDLRKVSGSSLTFSAVPNKHPLLHSVSLSQELVRVPGLIDESGYIPPCVPQSLHADPYSYHRLACHMACGWTAVFDMARMEMTHIHAPPSNVVGSVDQGLSADEAAHARRVGDSGRVALPHEVVTHESEVPERSASGNSRRMSGRQAGCWRNASEFVVPSRAKDALFIIDFSSSPHSGTRIRDHYSMDEMGQPKAAVDVQIFHAASSAVVSEPSGSILAFGADGRCSKVI